MAERANEQEDLVQERKIRPEINQSLNIERQLANSELESTRTPSPGIEDILEDIQ